MFETVGITLPIQQALINKIIKIYLTNMSEYNDFIDFKWDF